MVKEFSYSQLNSSTHTRNPVTAVVTGFLFM
nr:MAG TPA: hypothetical protein [Caudoviricetes sp.]